MTEPTSITVDDPKATLNGAHVVVLSAEEVAAANAESPLTASDPQAYLLASPVDLDSIRTVELRGEMTTTRWELPDDMTIAQWAAAGIALGRIERAVGWWIGDWWNYGEHRYGDRKAIVESPTWTGPSYKTCANAGSVSRTFDISRRRELLSFTHHAEVTSLAPERADELLDSASGVSRDTGTAPPTRDLRQAAKRDRRQEREEYLGEATRQASEKLGTQMYSVIYADPPWRFEPRSRETGMDRAADNHYPTMDKGELEALRPPAAPNCALFLWATVPMLEHALDLMRHWGFKYRTHWVWVKERVGTGYWTRNQHELLLLGIRGEMPAPAPGSRQPSAVHAHRAEHSVKPEFFALMIEEMFPSQPKLEMFARRPRDGWALHGNEVNDSMENADMATVKQTLAVLTELAGMPKNDVKYRLFRETLERIIEEKLEGEKTLRAVGGPHESMFVRQHKERVTAAAQAIMDFFMPNAL